MALIMTLCHVWLFCFVKHVKISAKFQNDEMSSNSCKDVTLDSFYVNIAIKSVYDKRKYCAKYVCM